MPLNIFQLLSIYPCSFVCQITALLELIGDLLRIVGRGHGQVPAQKDEAEEQAINRQTALYSLKLLCRSFGSKCQEAFVPVLNKAVELVANKDEEKNVMGSALLCVAEVTGTLKALAIPQLHRYWMSFYSGCSVADFVLILVCCISG